MSEKVVIAMSGGVDSSVAAFLLKQRGMAVEGVFFMLFDEPEAVEMVKKTAEFFKINLHIKDLRATFQKEVIEPFFAAYKKGITPNPCVVCNRKIKFPVLVEFAEKLKAKYVATGHYARVKNQNTMSFLLKGLDSKKDQSYFLYGLDRKFLSNIIFPLGEYTKEKVKSLAEEIALPSKVSKESTEVCFLKDRRYYEFIKPVEYGPIIDISTGKIIGQHKGIHLYTIGQRKRLGIASPNPLYVLKIDPFTKAIFVGTKEKAYKREVIVNELNWLSNLEKNEFSCEVKIRYAMSPEKALLKVVDRETVQVFFEKPQFAPTPGQSAVFYREDTVLGGGVIKETGQDF